MIVVFDTNVLISALQFGRTYGSPVQALEKAIREDVIATADELDEELIRILTVKFDWDHSVVVSVLQAIHIRSMRYRLKHTVKVCRDPADDMFLECAAQARADLLIAGDKDLLVLGQYRRTRIVTPAEYVRMFP